MIYTGLININLEISTPGVYLLGDVGGSGKTFLANILSDLNDTGEKVAVVTYKDGKVVVDGNLISADVIMYDRLDLYITSSLAKEIARFGEYKIVLVDLKNRVRYKESVARKLSVEIQSDAIRVR